MTTVALVVAVVALVVAIVSALFALIALGVLAHRNPTPPAPTQARTTHILTGTSLDEDPR